MAGDNQSGGNAMKLLFYWLVVGIPLGWGVWLTILKLPALFQ
jgi:hypothetical protein